MELIDYLPIFILLIIAVLFVGGALIVSHLVGRHKYGKEKMAPYESGMLPIGDARRRVSVKFYVVAILFILFDIEVVFMYPWAVIFKRLGVYGFVEMMVFIGILLVGFIYVWKKGALEWG
jgi:NADH-quinone oxidoreductase subunit A